MRDDLIDLPNLKARVKYINDRPLRSAKIDTGHNWNQIASLDTYEDTARFIYTFFDWKKQSGKLTDKQRHYAHKAATEFKKMAKTQNIDHFDLEPRGKGTRGMKGIQRLIIGDEPNYKEWGNNALDSISKKMCVEHKVCMTVIHTEALICSDVRKELNQCWKGFCNTTFKTFSEERTLFGRAQDTAGYLAGYSAREAPKCASDSEIFLWIKVDLNGQVEIDGLVPNDDDETQWSELWKKLFEATDSVRNDKYAQARFAVDQDFNQRHESDNKMPVSEEDRALNERNRIMETYKDYYQQSMTTDDEINDMVDFYVSEEKKEHKNLLDERVERGLDDRLNRMNAIYHPPLPKGKASKKIQSRAFYYGLVWLEDDIEMTSLSQTYFDDGRFKKEYFFLEDGNTRKRRMEKDLCPIFQKNVDDDFKGNLFRSLIVCMNGKQGQNMKINEEQAYNAIGDKWFVKLGEQEWNDYFDSLETTNVPSKGLLERIAESLDLCITVLFRGGTVPYIDTDGIATKSEKPCIYTFSGGREENQEIFQCGKGREIFIEVSEESGVIPLLPKKHPVLLHDREVSVSWDTFWRKVSPAKPASVGQ